MAVAKTVPLSVFRGLVTASAPYAVASGLAEVDVIRRRFLGSLPGKRP
jgi:hypothetical protein